MAKGIEGKFRAKFKEASFEKSANKEVPMIQVWLQPVGEYVGTEVQPKEGMRLEKKAYFLSMDLKTAGKYAGKSGIEATKTEFKETYGYEGPFNPDSMNAALAGKEVDIVCELNKDGYTDIKFVNAIGGSGKTRKPIKALTAEDIAAIDKVWGGKSDAPVASPSDLFSKLVAGAKENA